MDENETFRKNLLAALKEAGLPEATVAKLAGLNARAITDIRENRVKSPKLSTVFSLSEALGKDPGEMLGLGPRQKIQQDLAEFLSEYDEDEQGQFLAALRLLRAAQPAGR